jgi:uncharacterized protein YutE (UPF0331/DUF86 family)
LFRSLAVHAYQDIDWRIVHSIITTQPGDFTDYAKAMTRTARLQQTNSRGVRPAIDPPAKTRMW